KMKLTTTLTILISLFLANTSAANTSKTGMRNLTSMQIVSDMGAGWNLGNTLDTENYDETAWGNPLTTKRMIDEIRYKGFKTLRLPVTWRYHMGGAPNYTIEEEWLDKVEEIANYAFENDMYVIINTHHDDPWIIPTYAKAEGVKDKLSKLWTQVANRFIDYGDFLIFETLNEPRYEGSTAEWSGGTAEGRDCVNQYHKACVDAIRATGGNNAKRHLMVSTYAASTNNVAFDDLKIPNIDENCIISIHTYFPYQFCLGGGDQTWGTSSDKTALDNELDKVYNKFIANGRAVVMGEWGSGNQNNAADRLRHAEYYAQGCTERGFCPVWWDNGSKNGSGIFDRDNLSWYFPEIADAVVKAATNSISSGNPIIKHIRSADPSAEVWNDGKVWVYASHDQDDAEDYSSMDGYHVFSSYDMINWTDHGEILHSRDVDWGLEAGGWMFAPDAAYKDGTYYLYFPHMGDGWKWRVGVATSDKPEGPFTDIGNYIEGPDHIDPTCFVDDDGQAYLMWGGDNNPPKIAKLKENMTELAEEPRVIDYGFDNFGEGGYMHKQNGKYYFSYTCQSCYPYNGYYAMSDSPYGPFDYKGELNLSPPGAQDHHSIIEYHGQSYYFYHLGNYGNNASMYRRNVCVDSLFYNEDGTMKIVVQTKTGVGPDKIGMEPGKLVPGRIEAEDYFQQSGIDSLIDDAGATVIHNINDGDYLEYVLHVLGTEEYTAELKLSNPLDDSKIYFFVNEKLTDSITVTASSDIISKTILLHKGKHTLKLVFSHPGETGQLLDLDWINMLGSVEYFTIDASAGVGGSIKPEGKLYVAKGDSVQFSMISNTSYIPDSLVVNGIKQAPTESYTFHSVIENHSIEAYFTSCESIASASYFQINSGEILSGNVISLTENDNLKIWVEYEEDGILSWAGPQGLNSAEPELLINSIQVSQKGIYSAYFINNQGCKSEVEFDVRVDFMVLDVFEAEDFFSQDGTQNQVCSDLGGGRNMGFIENNDWCYYSINIEEDGYYDLIARVSSAGSGGSIEITIKDTLFATIPVDSSLSDGWQDWYTTLPIETKFTEGNHKLKFTFKGGDGYLFNFNWFDLTFNRAFEQDTTNSSVASLTAYPNPFISSTNIVYILEEDSLVKLEVFNSSGATVKTLISSDLMKSGKYNIEWNGTDSQENNLNKGIYFVRLQLNETIKIGKILLL
nr:cellulase family glycosylhydrolase [Bacteroidales bacterium]